MGRIGSTGRMVRITREEETLLADWRRDRLAIRKLANEAALVIFEREYERAMGAARTSILDVASGLRGKR